jgi:hypothetical protein
MAQMSLECADMSALSEQGEVAARKKAATYRRNPKRQTLLGGLTADDTDGTDVMNRRKLRKRRLFDVHCTRLL